MIRTRAIIPHFSYDDLVKQNIIPDLHSSIEQSPNVIATKRYSPFVYSNPNENKFTFFGMFYDYVIRAGLRINLIQPVELGTDPVAEIIQQLPDVEMLRIMNSMTKYTTSKNLYDIALSSLELTSCLYGTQCYSATEIGSHVGTITNVIKDIIARWNYYAVYLQGTVHFNKEYTYKSFSGHPDIIVGDHCVLDIKNTSSFKKMSKEACLQVLSYN